ncbi:MAG: hypothetical protein AB7K68_12045 [Bacteriovoracia bacterium]
MKSALLIALCTQFLAPATFAGSAEVTISKKECLAQGGQASTADALCHGGQYDGHTIVECSYQLDGMAYVGKDDGVLTYAGKKYRCETAFKNESETNLCRKIGSKSKKFDFVVAFDGTENDFSVFKTPYSENELCHSVAVDGKK